MTEPVFVQSHYRGGGGPGDPAGPGGAPPPGDGSEPPPGGGGGALSTPVGPLPLWGWLALAGALAVGAYFWVRKGRAGAAAASAPASTAGSATDSGCYDAAGNSTPCAQADYASEIASLQDEIDNMQGGGSTPISTPGAGSTLTVAVPNVVGDGAIQARATLQAAGLYAVVQGGNRGTVTAQSPGAGESAQVGSYVTITTSANRANIPQVSGAKIQPRMMQVTPASSPS